MSETTKNTSEAEWYCRKDTEKERAFIEEITRVTYERDYATRNGLPLSEVRTSFAS